MLDTITFNERSIQGAKYLAVLKDLASGAYKLTPLHLRSDATIMIKEFNAFGEVPLAPQTDGTDIIN